MPPAALALARRDPPAGALLTGLAVAVGPAFPPHESHGAALCCRSCGCVRDGAQLSLRPLCNSPSSLRADQAAADRAALRRFLFYEGLGGRAPPSLPWHAFYRTGRAASRARGVRVSTSTPVRPLYLDKEK
jgi:hypothetical protein